MQGYARPRPTYSHGHDNHAPGSERQHQFRPHSGEHLQNKDANKNNFHILPFLKMLSGASSYRDRIAAATSYYTKHWRLHLLVYRHGSALDATSSSPSSMDSGVKFIALISGRLAVSSSLSCYVCTAICVSTLS